MGGRETGMNRTSTAVTEDLDRLERYLHQPRTMPELVREFARDRKTIFRWLKALDTRGARVIRVGFARPTLYAAGPASGLSPKGAR